jgi:hypothetical protein
LEELGHGVTLATAGVVGELLAPVEADVAEPAGEDAVAPPVRPWLAGST